MNSNKNAGFSRDFLEKSIRIFTDIRLDPEYVEPMKKAYVESARQTYIERMTELEFLKQLENFIGNCYVPENCDTPFPETNEIAVKIHKKAFCYLAECLEKEQYEKARCFADALHCCPEIFLYGRFAPVEWWNVHYAIFTKKYNESPLEEYADWFNKKLPLCGIHWLQSPCAHARFDSFPSANYSDFPNGIIRGGDKIMKHEVTPQHIEMIKNITFSDGKLHFPENSSLWMSGFLGHGEEKAVYVVRDRQSRIFALEIIDEKHYLNGRLVDGEYFATIYNANLRGIRFNPESVIGLEFTGLVKMREFIYGYEWSGYGLHKNAFLNSLIVQYLRTFLRSDFERYYENYKDVHERNVMFELCHRKTKGVPLTITAITGRKHKFSVRLRGIDLR